MSERQRTTESGAAASSRADWDVESVVEQIWSDLEGTVTRPTIRQELSEVILRFEGAPIQTYVPIFARRRTVERLRDASPGIAPEGLARDEKAA